MEKNNFQTFNNLKIIVKGGKRIPKGEEFSAEGYPYIRAQDNKMELIFSEMSPKINESIYQKLKNYEVKYNDIIITNVGNSIGDVGLFKEKDMKCILTENCVKVYNRNSLIREYIYAFMKTKYGESQIKRETVGTAQPKLALERIREFKIIGITEDIQLKIKELIDTSVEKIILSKKLYSKAEHILISELGLENFNPSNEKVSIKTLKESFLKTGRLDSEYYQPKYEIFDEKISNVGVEKLENICSLINYGTVPTSPYVKNNKSIPYIKGMNLKNCFIVGELDEIESTEELQDKYFTKENDIIISQMGTVGDVGVVTKEQENYLFASFTIRVRLNDERFNPYFVGAYIQNVAKDFYLYRNIAQASVRQNTDLPTIKNMPIPLVKKEVQDEIASYIKQSMEYSKKAKELLEISTKSVEIAIDKDEETAYNFLDRQTDRQTLIAYYNEQASYYINHAIFRLYEEIGLFDGLKSVNYTVKNLKDTFGISGRLDSEYYQEKYDRLFKKLSDNNCDKLSNLVTIKKSIEPGSERYQTKGIPFIRVQDLTKFGLTDTSIYLSENEFKTCIRPKKDTILLSKDGTVGIAYKMNKDEDIITSSAILHLNVKDKRVLPDYLTLVLNSVAVKMQAEKDAGGSIINHWKKCEIENVIIPIVEKKKQEQISKLLIESETLRSESKSILEKAVKSVEMAIECGEEKALYYLNSK